MDFCLRPLEASPLLYVAHLSLFSLDSAVPTSDFLFSNPISSSEDYSSLKRPSQSFSRLPSHSPLLSVPLSLVSAPVWSRVYAFSFLPPSVSLFKATCLHSSLHPLRTFVNSSPSSFQFPISSLLTAFSISLIPVSTKSYRSFSSDAQTHRSGKCNSLHFLLLILPHRMTCSTFALYTQLQTLMISILLRNSALKRLLFYGLTQLSCSLHRTIHSVLSAICCHECRKSNVYSFMATFISSASLTVRLKSLFGW